MLDQLEFGLTRAKVPPPLNSAKGKTPLQYSYSKGFDLLQTHLRLVPELNYFSLF